MEWPASPSQKERIVAELRPRPAFMGDEPSQAPLTDRLGTILVHEHHHAANRAPRPASATPASSSRASRVANRRPRVPHTRGVKSVRRRVHRLGPLSSRGRTAGTPPGTRALEPRVLLVGRAVSSTSSGSAPRSAAVTSTPSPRRRAPSGSPPPLPRCSGDHTRRVLQTHSESRRFTALPIAYVLVADHRSESRAGAR
jgi:hypothetical protein